MSANPQHRNALIAQLIWQSELGADEAIHDRPSTEIADLKLRDILPPQPDHDAPIATSAATSIIDGTAQAPATPSAVPSPTPAHGAPEHGAPAINTAIDTASSAHGGIADPQMMAQLAAIDSLSALRTALADFDQCALKNTASNLVFSDGNPGARVMLIGEAPGRDEDRVGLPFVGASGQLLDKMLASIGLDRTSVYIANLLPWRPPGNRTPTAEETSLLLPWLKRHIQLANPECVMILGGSSTKALLGTKDGILKMRGKWRDVDYGDGINRPTICSLHPAFLLRSPAQKRLAFYDLLALAAQLET